MVTKILPFDTVDLPPCSHQTCPRIGTRWGGVGGRLAARLLDKNNSQYACKMIPSEQP
jgi:hypothetical protein